MSGAEAIVVLGLISSIVQILDATKQVYDAATNRDGLPEAFRNVARRLPIIKNILICAKEHIDKRDVDEDSCKAVKQVVEDCERKAKKLDALFNNAVPANSTSDLKRYYTAVKALGKGNEVENLMKGILEDVQLLACEHGMRTATKAQKEDILQAITEVTAVTPSVPEDIFNETILAVLNSNPSMLHKPHGGYITQDQTQPYSSAGGTVNIGKD